MEARARARDRIQCWPYVAVREDAVYVYGVDDERCAMIDGRWLVYHGESIRTRDIRHSGADCVKGNGSTNALTFIRILVESRARAQSQEIAITIPSGARRPALSRQ